MPDEIRYSTRPDGHTLSRATADTRAHTIAVLDPAQLSAASPELLQRVSVVAGLPLAAVRDAAASLAPVVLGRFASVGDAAAFVAAVERQHGLRAAVWDSAISASARAMRALLTLAGVAAGLVAGGLFAVSSELAMWAAIAGGALVAAAFAVHALAQPAAARAQRALERDAGLRAASFDERTQAAVRGVRLASLGDDVPVEAQVEVWRQLEEIEQALASGRLDAAQAGPTLAAAEARLRGGAPGSVDPLAGLERSAAAAQRARQELGSLR